MSLFKYHLPNEKWFMTEMKTHCKLFRVEIILLSQNQEEHLQGIFVYGEHMSRTFVSGSVNWAKAGRHFKLEMCAHEEGQADECYTWSETDTKQW